MSELHGQVYKTFTINVIKRPRVTQILNNSEPIYFNAATVYPRVYFQGVNLSDHELIKLVGNNENCSSSGNASLHSPGAHVSHYRYSQDPDFFYDI